MYVICLCKTLRDCKDLQCRKHSDVLQCSACMTVMYRAKTDQPNSVSQTGSAQVTCTFEPGIHRFMNSAISRQDPVPDKDCTAATLLSAMASLLSPYASLMDTWLKSFRPPIGRYLQAHCCGNQLEQLMVYTELHTCSTVSHRPDLDQRLSGLESTPCLHFCKMHALTCSKQSHWWLH